jgi:hypothetical protein
MDSILQVRCLPLGACVPFAAIGSRTSRQKTAIGPISVEDFDPVDNGKPYPLSERYAMLAAAQTHYPFVTSLPQVIDCGASSRTVVRRRQGRSTRNDRLGSAW